ncbi:MAG TPA: FAD/NAD(P)-binding protein [Gammaproteobacteria bacterium]|nr:FAD/NAD(P)-binding protein [Gammaproteobacteria bacterium]
MHHSERVIIIGGGFSGVALAAELVRRGAASSITLVESGDRVGRGLAYGTASASHLLNTRADQMSLYGDDPEHFLRWRRRGGHATHGAEFVRRSDYGEYLERALIAACTEAPHARLTVEMGARATDVERTAGGFAVSLADGRELRGDAVVLATGHPAPADPFGGALPASATRYLREPSRHEDLAKIAPGAAVLLIGTGLTAVDVVLALEERGHRGPVHAVSRRGLLPRAHRARRETLPTDLHRALAAGVAVNGLRGIVAALRSVAAAADEHGVGWQAAFDALRPLAPRIWAELCAADRRRFVRLLRPFWDVHRHRLPPAQAGRIAALRARGRVVIRAGRVRGGVDRGDSIVVDVQPRGSTETVAERYDWVVNCTGASFAKSSSRPLERRLLEQGLLLADPLGLGYVTDDVGGVLGASGPVRGLYVLGPACRAAFWEHTAVPELRAQAAKLAADLAGRCATAEVPVRLVAAR